MVEYHAMNPSHKKKLLEKHKIEYKSMHFSEQEANVGDKEANLERNILNMKRKYHANNSPRKAKKHEAYQRNKLLTEQTLYYFICKYHNKIREGPYYICSVCNRLLYKKSVRLLDSKTCSSEYI